VTTVSLQGVPLDAIRQLAQAFFEDKLKAGVDLAAISIA
jgi:hypothetical protein